MGAPRLQGSGEVSGFADQRRAGGAVEPGAFDEGSRGDFRDAAFVLLELSGEDFDGESADGVVVLADAGFGAAEVFEKHVDEGEIARGCETEGVKGGLDERGFADDDVGFVTLEPLLERCDIDFGGGLLGEPALDGMRIGKEVHGNAFFRGDRFLFAEEAGGPETIDGVVPAAMHDEADAPVAFGDHLLHREADDVALIVGDIVQCGLVGEVVDFDRAELRPVEEQGVAVFAAVGGDDDAVDAAGVEDAAESALGEAGFAHPEVVEIETDLLSLGDGAGVELGVGGGGFPAEAGVPVGDVGDRGGIAPRNDLAAVGDERAQQRVGRVAHFLRETLDALAGGFGKPGVIAQRQRDSGDVHAGLSCNVGESNATSVHRVGRQFVRTQPCAQVYC